MQGERTHMKSPAAPGVAPFLILVFLLSAPFWALGFWWDLQLLPGLPVSAFMVVCPSAAAAFLVGKQGGAVELRHWLAQAVDCHRMPAWAWLATVGVMPSVMLVCALLQIQLGRELPAFSMDLGRGMVLFLVFLVAATLEELGWTGFATRRLLARYSVLATGLVVGLISVAWHIIPLLQVDRPWGWIAWWALGTMLRRLLIVLIYARGGASVFGASLFHAMSNLSWMLFPVMGSHYDPMLAAVVLAGCVAVALALQHLAGPGEAGPG